MGTIRIHNMQQVAQSNVASICSYKITSDISIMSPVCNVLTRSSRIRSRGVLLAAFFFQDNLPHDRLLEQIKDELS